MKDERNDSLFVDVDTVQRDLGVSRAKAYGVIKDLNNQLREQYPRAIIISGKRVIKQTKARTKIRAFVMVDTTD